MRQQPHPITKPHHVFAAAQHLLGEDFLASLTKKSVTQIYRWSADPDRCDQVSRNPMDILAIILDRIQELGREDVVEASLRVLAAPLGYHVQAREIRSDKNSAQREGNDCMVALGRAVQLLDESLEDGKIDEEECDKILPEALNLVRQAHELVDALMKRKA